MSRLIVGLLVLVVASSVAAEKQLTEAEKEVKNWSGTYAVTHFERDGVKTADAELKTMKVVLKEGDGEFHVGNEVTTSSYTVSPTKTPREIDCVYTNGIAKGMTIKGIYKIEAGRMTVCYGVIGKDRPTKFEADAGSGHTLYIIQLIKAGK